MGGEGFSVKYVASRDATVQIMLETQNGAEDAAMVVSYYYGFVPLRIRDRSII